MPQLINPPCLLRPPPLPLSRPMAINYSSFTTVTTRPSSLNLLRAPLNRTVRCMANPRRVKMVAKQIRRELSEMLITDKVLQNAILPETSLGADRYLSSITSITDVEVSSDLQVVKVYVSVFGDERGKEVALAGLKAKAKYVRGALAKRMSLRLTPEIRFIEDESVERASRVLAILDRIKDEKKSPEGEEEVESESDSEYESESESESESSDLNQGDKEWDTDDPEERIIYVQ